jgi:hypothetical protein
MNINGQLGASITYFTSRGKEARTWSLVLDVQASPSQFYPPIRQSTAWIGPSVKKENPDEIDGLLASSSGTGPVLDWLEPDNLSLRATEDLKDDSAMEGVEGATKFPDVRFMAKLDPELVVPYLVAGQLYESVGATLEAESVLRSFDDLLFPVPGTGAPVPEADGTYRRIRQTQDVPVVERDGTRTERRHGYTITVPVMQYGKSLSELPFSHPRQLVGAMGVLRQWARVAQLLQGSLSRDTKKSDKPAQRLRDTQQPKPATREDFSAFLNGGSSPSPSSALDEVPIDITLSTSPVPQLRVIFPLSNKNADVLLEIRSNGKIEVVRQNLIKEGEDGGGLKGEDLGRMLEVCGDLGVWVEFVRERFSEQES